MTTEELDKILCVEIPGEFVTIVRENKHGDRVELEGKNLLHHLVTSFMLHGPCGQRNPTLKCMKDIFCKYNFPKEYKSKTEMSKYGYPLYCWISYDKGGNVF